MLRTEHKGALLLVEGGSDSRAFRNLADGKSCRIVIAHGRENALVAMQVLEADSFEGVLAVLDADFSRLERAPLISGNILSTDLHDLECMMLASPAFDKLVGEFADRARVQKFEGDVGCALVESLAKNAMPLGYLRWVSLRKRFDLRFDELSFHKFVETGDLHIDVGRLIRAVKDHSQRHDIPDSHLEQELAAIAKPGHDPWELCCGHDLLEILSLALRSTVASRNAHEVKRETLERELRLAYQDTYFQQTDLARAIREWEHANPPYRVLPSR